MGMYDIIKHEITCPNCKTPVLIDEQIKWRDKRTCHVFHIGDLINVNDGVYRYATEARPYLQVRCKYCKTLIDYDCVVKDGILQQINVINSTNSQYINEEVIDAIAKELAFHMISFDFFKYVYPVKCDKAYDYSSENHDDLVAASTLEGLSTRLNIRDEVLEKAKKIYDYDSKEKDISQIESVFATITQDTLDSRLQRFTNKE